MNKYFICHCEEQRDEAIPITAPTYYKDCSLYATSGTPVAPLDYCNGLQ